MIENLEVKAEALRELIDHTVGQGDCGCWYRPSAEKLRDVLMTAEAIEALQYLISQGESK